MHVERNKNLIEVVLEILWWHRNMFADVICSLSF